MDQREADWYKVRSEAIRRTKVTLDIAGVDMPVPIYQVNLRQPSGSDESSPRKVDPESIDREAHEVTVDDYIEEQIDVDRRLSSEHDDFLTQGE